MPNSCTGIQVLNLVEFFLGGVGAQLKVFRDYSLAVRARGGGHMQRVN